MVRWGDYIKRTVVRRVIWIIVGLAVYAVIGFFDSAWANDLEHCFEGSGAGCSREEAYAATISHAQIRGPSDCTAINNGIGFEATDLDVTTSGGSTGTVTQRGRCLRSTGSSIGWTGARTAYWSYACPTGSEWRDDLKRCFDPEECLNRNDNIASRNSVQTFTTACFDGCKLGPVLPSSCSSIIGEPGQLCAATYQYTGEACSLPPPEDPPELEDPPKERCVRPGGYDFSFCKKDDGRECYTIQGGSRAGQQVCWNPGETGRKVAGDTAQTRAPGSNEPPPPDPPPGESFEKVGESMTTETTNTSEAGSSTSTTTTRQDRTMYGTDAGGPGSKDDSEPPGDGTPGDGDGDEDDGDVSGGSDCSAPPVCTGDRLMCGLNEGLWRIRCDGSGDSATLIGDTITDIDGAIAEGEGDGDPDDTDMLEHADPDTWREIEQVNADDLDDTGFGLDRSCPVLPAVQVGPANMQFDLTPICTFLSWMSGLVLALAYFIAARIIAGVK